MKALVIKNSVVRVFDVMPRFFPEYGHVQRVDLLSEQELAEKGIKIVECINPLYSKALQRLGEPMYDQVSDVVTFQVINLEYNIDQLFDKRIAEFDQFEKNFRREITELFLEEIVLGTLPETVKQFIVQLKQRSSEVRAELQGFYTTGDIERLGTYTFYTEETAQLRSTLKSLKTT
ncbi:MAG: hypothetical protein ACK5HT_07555 [Draconibacterium sp.]